MDIYDRLDRIDDNLQQGTESAYESCRELAHLASELPFVPAPALYRALGEHKMTLWAFRDAIQYLSAALERSHDQSELRITDSDFTTGESRDPKTSVRDAMTYLERAAGLLSEAGQALDSAQSSIAGQGYEVGNSDEA